MRRLTAATMGLLAAGTGAAAAELLAAATRPEAGPIVAVGAAVIDATPTPLKEYAVRTFGTADKPILLTGITLTLAAIAITMGVLGARNRRWAVIGGALFGVAGAAAAISRPTGRWYDVMPSLLGAAVAVAVLLLLLRQRRSSSPVPVDGRPRLLDRRAFLATAALVSAGAAGGGAAVLRSVQGGAVSRARKAIRLPAPAKQASPLPSGLAAGFTTANADFYRVDTALTIPRVNVDAWSLRIGGRVDNPLTLSFADLLDRPLIERHITLNCVSNEVGGPYIGTARWLGVPLAPLLREAGVPARTSWWPAPSTA